MSTLIARAREQILRGHFQLFLNRAIMFLLGIYIFIIPFPHRTAIQEICFYSSLVLLAFLCGIRKQSISFGAPLSRALLLFVAWIFVTLFFSIDQRNSFHDFFAYLIKDMTLFFLVYNFFGSRERFVQLTWLIIVSAGIVSIGGVTYFYWMLKMPFQERLGLPEIGLGVNYIGYLTVLAVSFSVTHLFHSPSILATWISLFSIAGATLATLLTQTKGTLLGFVPILALLSKKKRILMIVLMLVGMLIFFMPLKRIFTVDTEVLRHFDGGRIGILNFYIPFIKNHPITGIGFGMQTYRQEMMNQNSEVISGYKHFLAPHNTFIDVTVRCGIPGLVMFLYILFAFSCAGLEIIRNSPDPFLKEWALCLMAVFASFLIQGFVTDMLLGIQVKYFFILLAMMAILWRWHTASTNEWSEGNSEASLPASQTKGS